MIFKHMPLKKLSCVLLAMVLMVLTPVAALADYKAVVTSATRVYAAPSKSAANVRVSKGTIVTVVDTNNGVAKITRSGNVGYMDLSDLSRMKPTEVMADGKVYQSASTSARSASIRKGTTVNLIDVSGSWAAIERGGNMGFVKKDILEPYYEPATEPSAPSVQEPNVSGASSKAEIVMEYAKSRVGCPYVYGKSGPSSFDCAGLVRYAYKQVGVSLSASAYGQGYGKGDKIAYADLKPGDIVCFDTNESDGDLSDHTGIYLGSGKFVHASSAGGKVMISSLSSGYYNRVFSWARRVL